MSPDHCPTAGGRALRKHIKSLGLSVQEWCEKHRLERVQIQRLISGSRYKRVSVDLATDIEKASGGKVRAKQFRSDTVRQASAA
jgi:hypothetical protein